jgi:beta-lactamase superfamily II metal-dependent hydrolase
VFCEIEFLAVGEGSRAGDAIIVRYGDVNNYRLMVVDGGTAESGENMVSHLRYHFGQNVAVSDVVLTHSDADHASGLREILKNIPVTNLWLHVPWRLSADAISLFKNKSWTPQGLEDAIRKGYDIVSEIVDLAVAAGCKIYYPFQGTQIGPFTVLSPSKWHYLYLLPQFDMTPDPDQGLIESANMWIGKAQSGLLKAIFEQAAATVLNWVPESWSGERLKDGGQTSASNESSVVLYANVGNERVLLTGDAGVSALWWSVQYAQANNLPLQAFSVVQIPHHGSRRNVGPSVLNGLLGPMQPEGTKRFSAFVSAPKDDDKHPRKIVLNAFMRRGGRVIATQGSNKIYWGGFPVRAGYTAAPQLPFSPSVENYD